jgi:Uma2 family endonuclease
MRMTVEQYHELIAKGWFAANERFELLEGVVVEKITKNPAHVVVNRRCEQLLASLLPPGWHIRSQDPITLKSSEPEPHLAVVRGQFEDYATRHPGGADIGLVIEVADASLVTDRFKGEIYAAAGIPWYWIVNIPGRVVELHASPTNAGEKPNYTDVRRCGLSDDVPLVLDGREIGRVKVSEILG